MAVGWIMILKPSLPFMSFLLEGLSETSTKNDRFLWKKRQSGGITGIHELHGSAITARVPETRFDGSIDQGGSGMGGQRSWLRGAALIGFLGLAWAPGTWAQTQTGASSLSGIGFMPQSVMGGSTQGGLGVVAVPMMGVGTQQGTGVNSANAMMMDPLGLSYVYGPAAIPMTRAQAGLFMLSTQQRMLGLGNGQISGTRPAGQDPTGRKNGSSSGTNQTAAHTRNANIPGGQAARYFNRGGTTMASRSQPPGAGQNFKRRSRYFPQTTQ